MLRANYPLTSVAGVRALETLLKPDKWRLVLELLLRLRREKKIQEFPSDGKVQHVSVFFGFLFLNQFAVLVSD